MTIYLLDDFILFHASFQAALQAQLAVLQRQASLFCFSDAASFLEQVSRIPPDICFLDIDLGICSRDGLELAQVLRKQSPHCQIIFLTNYLHFVTSSFDVRPTYYILKSELTQRLPAALRLAISNITPDPSASLSVVVQHKQQLLPLHSIIYFERVQRETRIVCKDTDFLTREHLSSLDRRLDDSFFRCHASFIIHFDCVSSMLKHSFCMQNGTSIPISRVHYEEAKTCFSHFLSKKVEREAHL